MDYYEVLGLNQSATKEEIKEAYRRLALKLHPDKHAQSPKNVRDGATHRFKQVSEAYEVLIDDRRRADYNLRSRPGGFNGASGGRGGGYSGAAGGGFSGGGYGYGYGYDRYNGGKQRSYYRPSYSTGVRMGGWVFEVNHGPITARSLLLNLAFAGMVFGGSWLIEKAGGALWERRNSGKSFEEVMESMEKNKSQNEKR